MATRSRTVLFRVTPAEYEEVQAALSQSQSRTVSDMAREVVMARVRGGSILLGAVSDADLITELQARLGLKKPHPE